MNTDLWRQLKTEIYDEANLFGVRIEQFGSERSFRGMPTTLTLHFSFPLVVDRDYTSFGIIVKDLLHIYGYNNISTERRRNEIDQRNEVIFKLLRFGAPQEEAYNVF